jgi:outer membrane protein assembly factor BamB
VKHPIFLHCLLAPLLALTLGAAAHAAGTATDTRASNWPQWRGPDYDGVSKDKNLPVQWSSDRNIAWKLDLPGRAGSTPIVWGNRIFLTSTDGNDLVLLCISTAGKELWKRTVGRGNRMARGGEGDSASPTPSTDGKHVYVFVGSGDLACFDFDGKQIWKFNVQERYGRFKIQFGMHSTPLLYGDRLYLQLIHSGGAWVVALDKTNGKDVWKVERKSDGVAECEHSYASPCLYKNGKEAYLITHGNDYAIAHRLSDGSEIWRVGGLNPKNHYNRTLRFVASPVATPELIVVPSAKNGPVVGLRPDARGLVMDGSKYEQWRLAHNTPDVPSPLVHDGLVYLSGESGMLRCLEAKTGKRLYEKRLHAAKYRASPVLADGKLYLTARDGVVSVIQTGPTFKLLGENRLPDQMTASPAIAGGRIFLRGFDALYAIEKKRN